MPELQLDVAVANRFISSLSKSLQALCHGCMDFDSGIEIVGYININIDSGSKVDYVLNEKVLKSTTNSMTFVSNSFLAKKDHPKPTRDGACSPIPQPPATPYVPRMRGSHFSSPYQRSQLSPHLDALRGSQKRARMDDSRFTPKKYHHQRLSTESQYSSPASQYSHSMSSSGIASHSDSSFKHSQVPNSLDNINDSTLQLQMRIKEEALETDNQKDTETEHLDQQSDPSRDQISKLQVKSDPDETNTDSGENNTFQDSNLDNTETDLKNNFLEENASEITHKPSDEDNDSSQLEQSIGQRSELSTNKEHALADDINMPSTSAFNPGGGDAGMSSMSEPLTDVPVEYDQAGEDESYSQPAYEEAGEGSSEAGQFEVIEIDDEDEDVQAMFGDHHSAHSSFFQPLDTTDPNHQHNLGHNPSLAASSARNSKRHLEQTYSVFDPKNCTYRCPICAKEYKTSTGARLHYNIKHCGAFDHYCQACGKGFQQKSHLKAHMSLHMQQKDFECRLCGSRYAHKTSLTAHHKLAHGVSF